MFYLQVVQEALDKAKLTEKDLSAVAVTIGPGLSLCLRGNLLLTFFLYTLELKFIHFTGDDLIFIDRGFGFPKC